MSPRRGLRSSVDRFAHQVVWGAWDAAMRYGSINGERPRGRRFAALGRDSVLCFPPGGVFGEDRISIGAATLIGPHTSISAGYPVDSTPVHERRPLLHIGDRCVIGRDSTITAHVGIHIGNDVWTGGGVFISDQNHGWTDLDTPIGRQFGSAEPVSIGDGSWLGHGAKVLPGVTIGRHVIVAAGAIVVNDVPDHTIVAGVPAKPVRRLAADGTWTSVERT
jgi:acetyltransferase-like isoleucine patch superfamily enzyme